MNVQSIVRSRWPIMPSDFTHRRVCGLSMHAETTRRNFPTTTGGVRLMTLFVLGALRAALREGGNTGVAIGTSAAMASIAFIAAIRLAEGLRTPPVRGPPRRANAGFSLRCTFVMRFIVRKKKRKQTV